MKIIAIQQLALAVSNILVLLVLVQVGFSNLSMLKTGNELALFAEFV